MSRSKARKERDALRTARRDSLLILLSRAQRGVLSRPEAAQLRVHVEAELTLADQTRASAGGQQAAQQRTAHQLEAAHEAIVEAEQRAKDAEEQLRAYRAVFGDDALDAHSHALARASRAEGALAAVRNATGPTSARVAVAEYDRAARLDAEERADRYRLHCEKLRHGLAGQTHRARSMDTTARNAEHARRNLAAILAKPSETPFDELTEYAAKTLTRAGERLLEAAKRTSDAELDASRAEAALAHVRNAQTLGQALAAVARYDGLTTEAAAVHAAFTDAADSTQARLDEQAREHAIELAHAARGARDWHRWGREAEQRAARYRAAWMSARRRAGENAAEEQRVRGWAGHWAQHYREARAQLDRTRTAWRSARRRAQERTRDAYANAAEYREAADALEQHLAAVADEPIAYALADQ